MRRIPSRFRRVDEAKPWDPLPRKSLYEEAAAASYWARWVVVVVGAAAALLDDRAMTPTVWALLGVAAYNTALQMAAGMRREAPLSVALALDALVIFVVSALRGPLTTAAPIFFIAPLLLASFAYGGAGAFAGIAAFALGHGLVTFATAETITGRTVAGFAAYTGFYSLLAPLVGYIVERYEEVLGELLHQSVTDPLTGLFNRRFFTDALERVRRVSHRHGQPFSVILIDVKGFKAINDALGHDAGDQVLIRLADHFLGRVRMNDIVARIGGDEFAVLLPATGLPGAVATACRLIEDLEETDPVLRPIALSMGVSQGPAEPDEPVEHTLLAADRALIQAKHELDSQILIVGDERRGEPITVAEFEAALVREDRASG
ncbi:MAG: GGDEF domain-containing protein [Gemmatimonadetes bacterium]|nr:GGDEF domain-containing protein [Gemmatimonadota bacterium]